MHRPILSNDPTGLQLPAPNLPALRVAAVLWLAFACALPLYQLRAARRQAHRDLQHLLASERADTPTLVAAFDRSNQNMDAAASGPCFILALTIIFLVNQMFWLKRGYDELAHELSVRGGPAAGPHTRPKGRAP